jgi:hypothetical protein
LNVWKVPLPDKERGVESSIHLGGPASTSTQSSTTTAAGTSSATSSGTGSGVVEKVDSMDVNALNYCRFSYLPISSEIDSSDDEGVIWIGLPNLVESSCVRSYFNLCL